MPLAVCATHHYNFIISVDDCRKRWKNMKDTYNRHKRNRKLGTGSSALSKPTKWALSDALSFLDVVLYERE